MSFEKTYRIVFLFCEIFGMIPYRYENLNKNVIDTKKTNEIFILLKYGWLFGLLAFEFYILIYSIIVCYEYVLVTKVTLYTGLDVFILTTFRILLIIITLESFIKRNAQIKILNNLCELDDIFMRRLNVNINYKKLGRLVRFVFLKWFSIYILTEILLIWLTLYEEANSILIFLILFVYPLFKLTLNGSKYVTFVHLIKFRIEAMYQALNNFVLQTELNVDDPKRIELNRMLDLWNIYNKIYETVHLINYSFSWSFSINFSVEILAVCAVLFHVLDYILGEPNRFAVISLVSFGTYLFYYVFRVIMLIQITHSAAEKVDIFASKIHRLSSISTNSNDFVRQ